MEGEIADLKKQLADLAPRASAGGEGGGGGDGAGDGNSEIGCDSLGCGVTNT